MNTFLSILLYALDIYTFVIFIRILASWLPGIHHNPIMRYIADITDPVLQPIGKIIPPVAGIDFAPMALLFLIWGSQELLRIAIVS